MADTKISELPVATAVTSPDVAPIVQSGVTKQVDVSLLGRSFLSYAIARVDPSGSDATGIVGDLTKPFLTVQGAINAGFNGMIIDVGSGGFTENVTTSLTVLSFTGTGVNATAYKSLTFTEPTDQVSVFLNYVAANSGAISAISSGGIEVEIISSLVGDITSSGGALTVFCFGNPELQGILSAPGFSLSVNGPSAVDSVVQIDSAGSNVTVNSCAIYLYAAASITLIDSRITTNNAGIIPTYADILLANPIFPNSDPHIVGAGYWLAGVLTRSAG